VTTIIIVMIATMAIALIVIAIVAIGMRGRMSDDASDFALFMASTGKHLSGDAEPPAGFVKAVDRLPRPGSAPSASERD